MEQKDTKRGRQEKTRNVEGREIKKEKEKEKEGKRHEDTEGEGESEEESEEWEK